MGYFIIGPIRCTHCYGWIEKFLLLDYTTTRMQKKVMTSCPFIRNIVTYTYS